MRGESRGRRSQRSCDRSDVHPACPRGSLRSPLALANRPSVTVKSECRGSATRYSLSIQEVHLWQQVALVGEERGNGQAESGADVGIRKKAAGAAYEKLAVLSLQVSGDVFLAVEALQHREGLHKHADALRHFGRAPAVDRSVKRLLRPGKAAEQVAVYAGEERAGPDVKAMRKRREPLGVDVQGDGEPGVLRLAPFLVVDWGAADFRIGQQLVIPRFGRFEDLRVPRVPLPFGVTASGLRFALRRFPGVSACEDAYKHRYRSPVKQNVMDFHEKVKWVRLTAMPML